jgi:hypothetical protein
LSGFYRGERDRGEAVKGRQRGGETWQVEPFISEAAMFLYENGVCEYHDAGTWWDAGE